MPIPTTPAAGPRQYVTLAEYQVWIGDETAAVSDAVLVRASLLIDRALIGAVYDTDDQWIPTDAGVLQAIKDAVCAQVQWWDETGDTNGTGAAGQYASAAIGSANYTRAQGSAKGTGKSPVDRLAPLALDALHVAGLLPVSPYTHG